MIIYEVNLTINNDIYDAYYQWLIEHVHQVLLLRGFSKAEIAKEQHSEDAKKITVRYTLESEEDLNHYLANQAPAMRADGIKRFGDKFSAFRRIFGETLILEPKS